jgi:hypothetical protein
MLFAYRSVGETTPYSAEETIAPLRDKIKPILHVDGVESRARMGFEKGLRRHSGAGHNCLLSTARRQGGSPGAHRHRREDSILSKGFSRSLSSVKVHANLSIPAAHLEI